MYANLSLKVPILPFSIPKFNFKSWVPPFILKPPLLVSPTPIFFRSSHPFWDFQNLVSPLLKGGGHYGHVRFAGINAVNWLSSWSYFMKVFFKTKVEFHFSLLFNIYLYLAADLKFFIDSWLWFRCHNFNLSCL